MILLASSLAQFAIAQEIKPILQAAVGEGYKNGLHAKYLKYFADKLSISLEISSMPYPRRIKELEKGYIDMMVGIQCNNKNHKNVLYITPPYEHLSYSIFTLKNQADSITSYKNFTRKIIAVNQSTKFFPEFDNNKNISKFKALNLNQKINMLLKARVDAFVHLSQPVELQLAKLKLTDKIVKSPYQNNYKNSFCLAISKKSILMSEIKKLESIVITTINNNEIGRIRQQHYLQ